MDPQKNAQIHSVAAFGRDAGLERRVPRNVEPRTGGSAALPLPSAPRSLA